MGVSATLTALDVPLRSLVAAASTEAMVCVATGPAMAEVRATTGLLVTAAAGRQQEQRGDGCDCGRLQSKWSVGQRRQTTRSRSAGWRPRSGHRVTPPSQALSRPPHRPTGGTAEGLV